MLRSRVIPCLLVQKGRLVKTVRFADPVYVGDPLNAVRLFNEKQVDELVVLDISATSGRHEPDYDLIEKLATVCRMPLCYGGGVQHPEQVERIVGLGVEKVALSSALIGSPELLRVASRAVGSQSLVAVLDVRHKGAGDYEIFIENGRRGTGLNPVAFAKRCEQEGAGEIVVNSIDRDGTMVGYDLVLTECVRRNIQIPMTTLGGAGSLAHIEDLFGRFYPIGAAAGSLFVFKGRFKAVLINYPVRQEIERLHAVPHGS